MFDQSVWLIGTSRPLAFFLDESDKVPSYQQGRWWRHRVEELTAYGYRVHWAIYNASQHGLPQNRPRLWAVGIKRDTPGGERVPRPGTASGGTLPLPGG
ncbi:MAG: DNA cytosine methyltransferase, partial [Candidatus Fonsibacter sp.]